MSTLGSCLPSTDILMVRCMACMSGESHGLPLEHATLMQVWRDQILDFMAEFVDSPAILVGNSIGSLACLMVRQAIGERGQQAGGCSRGLWQGAPSRGM